MKVTDVFTLFHKNNPSAPVARDGAIQPVAVIEKMSLQPGQIFRGEVLGEDANGHLLLKIGGEIIATRGLVSMTTGQQVWVELKEVGDTPLFALAQAKGAIHDLLKNIMDIRPAILSQDKVDAALPLEFQTALGQPESLSFVPKLNAIHPDGTLPRETHQFFKALLDLPKAEIPPLNESKMQQLTPLLSEVSGKVDIGKVAQVLSQTGKIPPVLGELTSLRPLFMFIGAPKGEVALSVRQGGPVLSPQVQVSPSGLVGEGQSPLHGKGVEPLVPFITSDGQVVAHVTQVVRSLVETVGLMPTVMPSTSTGQAEEFSRGFAELVRSILIEGKVSEGLHSFKPVEKLFSLSGLGGVNKNDILLKPMTAEELIKSFAGLSVEGESLSPASHNATVAKILTGLQGNEPRPELLRILKQLISSSSISQFAAGEELVDDEHVAKRSDVVLGVAKVASFFKNQALVNQEVAHVTQGDCVLVPCFFAGQSGWGEWMWSHESVEGQEQDEHENLAFFLEMSNLGPVSIQVILGEKSLSGQFKVAGETAYNCIRQGLPALEERLSGLGYTTQFTCHQKPVAVMQEIKDSLEGHTRDLSPSSLVDVQA